jgi:hypothetical protein
MADNKSTFHRASEGRMQRLALIGLTLIVAGLVGLIAFHSKALGPLQSAVLQGINVVLSVYGGIVFSKGERERSIRMAARSSARRVLVNYETLGRTAAAIEQVSVQLMSYSDGTRKIPAATVEVALSGLSNLVLTQISSADAAIKDWRDLAPTDVDEEISNYNRERTSNNGTNSR